MNRWLTKAFVPLLVALIGATGTVGAALLATQKDKSPSGVTPSPTSTPRAANALAKSECHQAVASKVCVANVTVQINSDEPQLVTYNQRIPLKTGDTLRVVNLHYCISREATVNRIEGKTYLFKNGIESEKYALLTPSSFPISTGCHNVGNFEKTWKVNGSDITEEGASSQSKPIRGYIKAPFLSRSFSEEVGGISA